jgi:hypothetical protein
MADFTTYLRGFWTLGSKATVKAKQKELLESMISFVPHTLTEPQKLQARKNIGIDQMFKTGAIVWLAKGEHYVEFDEEFKAAYVVLSFGTTGAAGFVPILMEWSDPTKFKVKMPIAGYLIWHACLVTEL